MDILKYEELSIEQLNLIWDRIENIIKSVIDHHIVLIKVFKFETNKLEHLKYILKQMDYNAKRLHKIIKALKDGININNIDNFNKIINNINLYQQTLI